MGSSGIPHSFPLISSFLPSSLLRPSFPLFSSFVFFSFFLFVCCLIRFILLVSPLVADEVLRIILLILVFVSWCFLLNFGPVSFFLSFLVIISLYFLNFSPFKILIFSFIYNLHKFTFGIPKLNKCKLHELKINRISYWPKL